MQLAKEKRRLSLLTKIAVVLCSLGATLPMATAEECNEQCFPSAMPALSAEQVWRPEIENLEWSEVQPSLLDKSWLEPSSESGKGESDTIVVRGVAEFDSAVEIAAAKHILPRLGRNIDAPWDRHFAMRRILEELKTPDSPLIRDRVSQTFFRTAGNDQIPAFTREALLLDISQENLQDLRHDVRRTIRKRREVAAQTLGISFGALAVTLFCCWIGSRFLDRLTRGYYVWPIRLATSLVLLASFGMTAHFAISILRSL